MADINILYIDDDELAIGVMTTIIQHTSYKLHHAANVEEFWNLISNSVNFDILIMEPKMAAGNISTIVKLIRDNPFLSKIPIVIYSKAKDKDAVKSMMPLDPQNYLFKPYKEKVIREEIQKAVRRDWRIELSGDADLFYSRADHDLESWKNTCRLLGSKMENMKTALAALKSDNEMLALDGKMTELAEFANVEGFPAYSNFLLDMLSEASAGGWQKILITLDYLPYAQLIQQYRIDLLKSYLEEEVEEEPEEEEEEEEEDSGKLTLSTQYTFEEIEAKITDITEFPVVESAAGMFAMMASEDEADLNLDEIVETITNDPGLGITVLKFSNSPEVASATTVEDMSRAVSLIGAAKVKRLALSFEAVPDVSSMFKAFRWQDFWAHQVGCAMLSEFIFEKMKLDGSLNMAYLGGLIHDIGKLLLCNIDPEGYTKLVLTAKKMKRSLPACELEYFSCDYSQAGLIFARQHELPKTLQNIIEFHNDPRAATEDVEVVGCVAFARYLCMKHGLGYNGETPREKYRSLTSHPAWRQIKKWLPLTFVRAEFNDELLIKIDQLKEDLAGNEPHR